MFNKNSTIMELYLSAEPEMRITNSGIQVCKCNAAMFQGKKDDGKKPLWVTIEAWKYLSECLAGLKKGDTVVISGSLKMDYWGDNDEHSRLVLSADSIAKKVWAPRNKQQPAQGGYQQQPHQQYQTASQQGYPAQQQFAGQPQAQATGYEDPIPF